MPRVRLDETCERCSAPAVATCLECGDLLCVAHLEPPSGLALLLGPGGNGTRMAVCKPCGRLRARRLARGTVALALAGAIATFYLEGMWPAAIASTATLIGWWLLSSYWVRRAAAELEAQRR